MVMGDNVLYEDEVAPVMDAALENGLEVTALHNHFFFEQPRLYFMHVSGMGTQVRWRRPSKKCSTRRNASVPPTAPLPPPFRLPASRPRTVSPRRHWTPSSAKKVGWPLIAAGLSKIIYDIVLYLKFRNVRPPEERPSTLPRVA